MSEGAVLGRLHVRLLDINAPLERTDLYLC